MNTAPKDEVDIAAYPNSVVAIKVMVMVLTSLGIHKDTYETYRRQVGMWLESL